MIYDNQEVLRDDGGAELARAEIAPDPAYARLTVGGESYLIVKPKPIGRRFQLLGDSSRIVYDFKHGLRSGGTFLSAQGEEIGKLSKHLVGFGWTIAFTDGEPIEVKREHGVYGSELVDGHTAPPALKLAIPATFHVGAEQARFLAFACWLIGEWEV